MMRFLLFFVFLIHFPLNTQAQYEGRNDGMALLVHFNYAYEFPGGDLAQLFGRNARVGGGLEMITAKNDLIFGFDGGLMFGNTIKDDVLATLRTPEGEIIGNNKVYADIIMKQRGWQASAHIGKIFSLSKVEDQRAGIRATIGMGLLQHKVRIQDDFQSEVPQIEGEYRKGYDRLTNGLMIQEFIGYQFLGANRLINFYAGIELTQAFTQNRRDWDFGLRRKLDEPRTDLLYGFRIGWTLPFYIKEDPENIYY